MANVPKGGKLSIKLIVSIVISTSHEQRFAIWTKRNSTMSNSVVNFLVIIYSDIITVSWHAKNGEAFTLLRVRCFSKINCICSEPALLCTPSVSQNRTNVLYFCSLACFYKYAGSEQLLFILHTSVFLLWLHYIPPLPDFFRTPAGIFSLSPLRFSVDR